MDKTEYFKISQDKGLTSRCPILDYCRRRAQTIYFFSDYKEENHTNDFVETLINAGELKTDYIEKEINMTGEVPSIMKGPGYGHFSNMCPEVSLFDSSNSIGYFAKTACSDGTWEKEEKPQFKILEEKHYSECSEFSKYFFENKTINQSNTAKPKKTECYTYLMIDLKSGFHKIGISSDPNYREKTLQSEQPQIETVIHRKFINRKLAKDFETELHRKYDYKRTRGEWFDLNPMEINEIIQLMKE